MLGECSRVFQGKGKREGKKEKRREKEKESGKKEKRREKKKKRRKKGKGSQRGARPFEETAFFFFYIHTPHEYGANT